MAGWRGMTRWTLPWLVTTSSLKRTSCEYQTRQPSNCLSQPLWILFYVSLCFSRIYTGFVFASAHRELKGSELRIGNVYPFSVKRYRWTRTPVSRCPPHPARVSVRWRRSLGASMPPHRCFSRPSQGVDRCHPGVHHLPAGQHASRLEGW